MGSISAQLEAILAVPIGGGVIALALGFFGLFAGVLRHVIERRAYFRDLADRMPGRPHE